MKNVVGLFDSIRDAEAVVRDLRDAGVAEADISFAGRNPDDATMQSNEYIASGHSEAAEGAGFGATGGAVVGGLTGLLVGLGVLAIPGVGPILAGGGLAAALGSTAVGAGIGAAAGGLLGALVGAGIPEEDAHVYAEGIRRGGALVMARVDESLVDTALDIMERHNAVDIDERSRMYRESGWAGYDESAGPYTGEAARGDADMVPDRSDWEASSKVGTAGGGVAGAATGAALGSAGGPVGTVIGGVAGAAAGAGIGAAGDAAGAEATDADTRVADQSRAADYNATAATGYDMAASTNYATHPVSDVDDTYTTTNFESQDTTGYSATNQEYRGDVDAEGVPDRSDWEASSKAGTAGGTLAGAATGAALGAAGGPVGAVIGGVAGAVTGGAIGAAGDAAGAEATDRDTGRDDVSPVDRHPGAYDSTTAAGMDATSLSGSQTGTASTGTEPPLGSTTPFADTLEPGATGDVDNMPDRSDWEASSKAGTAGGGVAGAATGAALGSAGGPVGTVIGGVAGAAAGAGLGAAGDAAGAEATDQYADEEARPIDRDVTDTAGYDPASPYAPADRDDRLIDRAERGLDADLDRDGDVGGTPRTDG